MTSNRIADLRYLSAVTSRESFLKNSRRDCVLSTRPTARIALVGFLLVALGACSETPRTATNFCRQLAKELPGITVPTATPAEVATMLERYRRLGKVAPLAIEKDWQSLTELLTLASRVNANDAESVQAVVDMAYSTENAAGAAAKWIKETCGVDISTGLNVAPTG
ncbi:MAG: hypothetical protein FJW43_00685 [Actinobacteria bacterium]|nr:hypothetical protein [Actinomycetota bacterium]